MIRNRFAIFIAAGLTCAVAATALADEPRERERKVEKRVSVRMLAPHAFLGVELLDLTPELQKHFGAADEQGVMVSRVSEGSPAERAGIEVGDLLTAIEGNPVAHSWEVVEAISDHEAGSDVRLDLLRRGQPQSLTARLEERQGMRLRHGDLTLVGHRLRADSALSRLAECEEDDEECLQELSEAMAGKQIEMKLLGKRIEEAVEGEAFQEAMRAVQERRGEMEARMRELEEKLRAMEAQLQRLEREEGD